MRNLLVFLLVCISVSSCSAGGLSVTGEVSTASGVTSYLYTLTNGTATPVSNSDFYVFMPESAARAVISFTCPGSVVSNYHYFDDAYSVWAVGVDLAPNESKTYVLSTPASVPSSYTFKPPLCPGNWEWQSHGFNILGTSILPVPVPEPSSVLALVGGVAGLAGLVLRRRER